MPREPMMNCAMKTALKPTKMNAHDTFAAGTSLYGVADLSVLAQDTHKFESRYLDGLVGPWPDAASLRVLPWESGSGRR